MNSSDQQLFRSPFCVSGSVKLATGYPRGETDVGTRYVQIEKSQINQFRKSRIFIIFKAFITNNNNIQYKSVGHKSSLICPFRILVYMEIPLQNPLCSQMTVQTSGGSAGKSAGSNGTSADNSTNTASRRRRSVAGYTVPTTLMGEAFNDSLTAKYV